MTKKTTQRKSPPQPLPAPENDCEEIGRELARLSSEPSGPAEPPETVLDWATGAGLMALYRSLPSIERETFLRELAQDQEAATTVVRNNRYWQTRDSRLAHMVSRLSKKVRKWGSKKTQQKTPMRYKEVVRLVEEQGFVKDGRPDTARLLGHFRTNDPEWKGRKGKNLTRKAIKMAYKRGKEILASDADERA